jgi:hypothetical protein
MRRLVPIALAALLLVALASPVAAVKPEKFANETVAQSFDAECGFDVELQDTFARGSVMVFSPQKDGHSKLIATGGFRSTLTSADSGKTIDVSFFGHFKYDIRPDGTILVRQSGAALWWFLDPADAGMLGLDPGLYIIEGHVEVLVDENFVAIAPATMKNVTIRDLCAELAP